jgi:hypothetical protein
MLPLPRHLLKTDPEEVLREIEDDPLSQFLWSFRPNLANAISKLRITPSPMGLSNDVTCTAKCCTQ